MTLRSTHQFLHQKNGFSNASWSKRTFRNIQFIQFLLKNIVIAGGFELLHEEHILSSYSGEEYRSMKPEVYNVPLTVFRLVDGEKRFESSTSCTSSFGDLHEDYNTEIIEEGEDYDVYPSVNFVLSKANMGRR